MIASLFNKLPLRKSVKSKWLKLVKVLSKDEINRLQSKLEKNVDRYNQISDKQKQNLGDFNAKTMKFLDKFNKKAFKEAFAAMEKQDKDKKKAEDFLDSL